MLALHYPCFWTHMLIYIHHERSYRHEWAPVAMLSSYHYRSLGSIDPCLNSPTLTNIVARNAFYVYVSPRGFNRTLVAYARHSGWRKVFLDTATY